MKTYLAMTGLMLSLSLTAQAKIVCQGTGLFTKSKRTTAVKATVSPGPNQSYFVQISTAQSVAPRGWAVGAPKSYEGGKMFAYEKDFDLFVNDNGTGLLYVQYPSGNKLEALTLQCTDVE